MHFTARNSFFISVKTRGLDWTGRPVWMRFMNETAPTQLPDQHRFLEFCLYADMHLMRCVLFKYRSSRCNPSPVTTISSLLPFSCQLLNNNTSSLLEIILSLVTFAPSISRVLNAIHERPALNDLAGWPIIMRIGSKSDSTGQTTEQRRRQSFSFSCNTINPRNLFHFCPNNNNCVPYLCCCSVSIRILPPATNDRVLSGKGSLPWTVNGWMMRQWMTTGIDMWRQTCWPLLFGPPHKTLVPLLVLGNGYRVDKDLLFCLLRIVWVNNCPCPKDSLEFHLSIGWKRRRTAPGMGYFSEWTGV